MERHNQFLRDFRLLLKKCHTERAIAEAMAKVVDGSIILPIFETKRLVC
jgi:hypothetical protein